MQLHNYGAGNRIPFMITLNGAPANPTLVAGDVKLIIDGAVVGDVINLPVGVDASVVPGFHDWIPTAAESQAGDYFSIYIRDVAGTVFDVNVVTHYTGGNASARFAG